MELDAAVEKALESAEKAVVEDDDAGLIGMCEGSPAHDSIMEKLIRERTLENVRGLQGLASITLEIKAAVDTRLEYDDASNHPMKEAAPIADAA